MEGEMLVEEERVGHKQHQRNHEVLETVVRIENDEANNHQGIVNPDSISIR